MQRNPIDSGGATHSIANEAGSLPIEQATQPQNKNSVSSPNGPHGEARELEQAAAYLRMSTEHQQYSLSNQMDAIQEYASRHGIEIVKIYSDGGKSGLSIQGRDALNQMIKDVSAKIISYTCILVYDVSRWGRFQDPDESAFYEHTCRRAGVTVRYCAEQFVNDGSPVSTIVKNVKRVMAGEYSRELSAKVFQGACRLIRLGYKQGGSAGFGLRRLLIDQNGTRKAVLRTGEQKSLQTDRVILIAGPQEECATVLWMYESFVTEKKSETEIAHELNTQGILTDLGRAWTRGTVHQVLTNEKYIGNNVYYRTSTKLKGQLTANPPDQWVRANGAFEAIVPLSMFNAAREIILERSIRLTDDEMLTKLRELCQQHGHLSGFLIDESEAAPSSSAYRHRFGSLVTAYKLIGYSADIDYSFIEINKRLRKLHPQIVASVIKELEERGCQVITDLKSGILRVNEELLISVVLCRHFDTGAGASRWIVRLDVGRKPDITIAVRMDATNQGVRDYYILPAMDMTWETLRVAEDNGVYLDAYRFRDLGVFMSMITRVAVHFYEN